MPATFQPTDLYTILSRLVRFFPPTYQNGVEQKNERLHTFAALSSRDDIGQPNLGKDPREAHKNFWFSRRWEDAGKPPSGIEWELPALFVYPGNQSQSPSYENHIEQTYTLVLAMGKMGTVLGSPGDQFEMSNEERQVLLQRLYIKLMRQLTTHVYFDSITLYGDPYSTASFDPQTEQQTTLNGLWVSNVEVDIWKQNGRIRQPVPEITGYMEHYLPAPGVVNGSFVENIHENAPLSLVFNLTFAHEYDCALDSFPIELSEIVPIGDS